MCIGAGNTGASCAPPHITLKAEDEELQLAGFGSTTAAICASEDGKLVAVRGACPAQFPHSISYAGVNIFDVLRPLNDSL